jgi:OOP family OmpA-OmpF porin
MRLAIFSAAALVGGVILGSVSGLAWAQSNPSSEQLIRSLTPTSTMGPSRGIHIANPTGPSAGPGAVPSASRAAGPATALPTASLSVLFPTGSAELTPAAMKTLDVLGKAVTDPRLAGGKFRIEGHTDTVGTPASNKALSDARAKAVANYLASAYHVDPSKLESIGMGEDGLLVKTPAQTPEARNRRVVVVNLGS